MLLSILRHISIRIWITVLLGGGVSLLVLPILQTRIGLEHNVFVAAAILLFFFLAGGWVLNRWALNSANYRMAEAGALERDGRCHEAENSFLKAAAIFDSFMITPFVKHPTADDLGARLARFYLTRRGRGHLSEDFLVAYLESNPQDEEVAEHWLHRIESSGGLKEEHQELAARIGDAQPDNNYIQSTLARFYLLLERTDFSALQTYRRVCNANASPAAGFIDDLAWLFVKAKRADEWALEIYLQAMANNGGQAEFLRGLAACVRWTPASGRNKPLLQAAQQYLKGIDADTLKKMRADFHPPIPDQPPGKIRKFMTPGALLFSAAKAIYRESGIAAGWIAGRIREASNLRQRSKKVRRILTAILLLGLTLGIGALVVNTVSHLTVQQTPAGRQETPAVKAIPDPFTLQVAAYLKPEYAKKYVQQLTQLGLDAYWSEAVSQDKRWYQVRVSHFATKQSARNYGEKLKSEGIIDDYYVANYRSSMK